ncbi:MAG: sugar ABC transporter permease [Achromobacter sp.]|jgi:multiple sugar transport system permease protein|uniref:sn-glycerol-3-phosphate transport system permease protein UgpA n=1 Tax=Achromobacter insuavis TaxID=1287735 RepID=A0A6J5BH27_9BURK|nr:MULTISPECIES: sugar ABC transporter permease [Achromobacter]MBN9638472.1 sugar ABC transporter permease [Achromobacter sp.]CAB3705758.1 sn-glycerol-3-phosphate transport system permease protein UgpA [Achromobacter insuavis]CUI93833.1 sn-glycerol-3-phosphate transport system permease protein ugpA [Achromobacter sp. 2789STDY5608633]CUJ23245.1 sn-glycerol-3-phosphate transport system permease protein ugpA [Achromobacter sp. 2789STDY5608628]CUJ29230.1 sn-glycerol-3-phosphate transport system pe
MKDRTLKYALLAPALAICAATLLYPLCQSLWYSLHDWNLGRSATPEGYVGWLNYADLLWHDPVFLDSAWVTLVFTVPSVVLTMAVALGLAVLLAGDGRLQVNARTLLVIPFAMSPALIGISWRFMLNPEFGAVDALLKAVMPGWSGAPVLADPVLAMAALILVDVWHWAPYFMLTFIGALAALPQDTLDAAQVDGAGRGRIFFEIVLPQLRPVLTIAILLKTIFSLKALDQVVTMTAGGPGAATDTLPHAIYSTAFRFYDIGYAAAMAWLLAIVMMGLALVYSRFAMGRPS